MAKRTSISVRRPPWRKWYPQDWRADAPLRMCSFAARGLWIDLLGLMHESTPVGLLLVNGVPPSTRQLAGLLGGTEREIKKLLVELGNANVYSVTGNALSADLGKLIPTGLSSGILFSRRMVRDEAKALQDRLNGSAGGNPSLPPRDIPEHQGGDRQDNDPVNQGVNPQANPHMPDARGEATAGLPPEENHTPSPVAARATGLESPHAHDADRALEVYQKMAARQDWPPAVSLTSDHRSRLDPILRVYGIDGWKRGLAEATTAEFLHNGDRGIKNWFSFDWLIDEDHFAKLMEGALGQVSDDHKRGSESPAPGAHDTAGVIATATASLQVVS